MLLALASTSIRQQRCGRLSRPHWTLERRQRQAELIRQWQPWKQSTGPQTPEGKATSSRNAWQGGHRAQLRELTKALNTELAEMRRIDNMARG